MPSHASNNSIHRLRALMVATLVAIVSTAAMAQTPTDEQRSRRIKDLRVEGAQSSSPTAIITYSGLRIGDFITGDNITRAIRNLMERRIFSDVKIYADDPNAADVTLFIVVREYPRVGAV